MDDVADLPASSTYSEDLEYWPHDHDESFEFSETSFLSFVPPPPRPMFLEEITTHGVTTCDMCSWAMKNSNALTLEGKDAPGELGWVLTLVIVSFTSALIGAVIMIIVLHCKRLKNSPVSEQDCGISLNHRQLSSRPPIHAPSDDKEISTITPANFPNVPMPMPMPPNVNGVWSWLARRSNTPPSNLNHTPNSHVMENHYTHMEDQYNVEEALYAELDRDDLNGEDRESNNSPAYQNSAYTDTDAPTSSAPSSAYYSDLSVGTMPERAYEIVGLSTLPTLTSWDPCGVGDIEMRRTMAPIRLAAISENVSSTVPSDYV